MNYFIPQYAPNMPIPNLCEPCGCNEFPIVDPVSVNGKSTVVLAGAGIAVADLSDANSYRFQVSRTEILNLITGLSLIAKELGVTRTSPILKGTVIDVIELDWTYNKSISSQALTNSGGLTPPTLLISDTSHDYVSQTITSNINFTITGNDGLGLPGSIATDTKGITFGDLMWLGYGPTKINTTSTTIESFIESLQTSVILTSRVYSYFATGGINQKHFVAYPKVFGLGTFTKGIFSGGYIRLKKVGTTLKDVLGDTDVESDIVITNSKGYAEAYYIYESLFDDQVDSITPFIIS